MLKNKKSHQLLNSRVSMFLFHRSSSISKIYTYNIFINQKGDPIPILPSPPLEHGTDLQ